ncbi:MAG: alanine racemase [Actinomycetota bacterium]
MRPTWADIDLSVIENNIGELQKLVSPSLFCAVVKADGYGHGAIPVARAAVDAGANWLAVALVEEGKELREAGIEIPILVLSEPRPSEMLEVVDCGLVPTVYSGAGISAASAAASASNTVMDVHLKVDTGMRRVGAEPSFAVTLAKSIKERPSLSLDGIWTHCAVADERNNPFSKHQLQIFNKVLTECEEAEIPIRIRHAANSALSINNPEGHYDMVRCGIATYGIPPYQKGFPSISLAPAMSLRSEVSFAKNIKKGEGVSYGLAWKSSCDTRIATVPMGYADGLRRNSGHLGAKVIIQGQKLPIIGNITMDQFLVDCGEINAQSGDEVVLIGSQGDSAITAEDWAGWLGTIPYEIICGVESRIPRRYV